MTKSERFLLVLEYTLLAAGLLLLVAFAVVLVHRSLFSHLALQAFDQASIAASGSSTRPSQSVAAPAPKFSGEPATRLGTGSENPSASKESPMAVLRFGRLGVRIPVFRGTSRFALNRGAAWIAGTGLPWEDGNIGIAGHRDSFFRVLKNVTAGDEIELATIQGTSVYEVREITVVSPNNVSVLRPRGVPSLTLVTCYPFNFIGSAPKRYIVSAALKQPSSSASFQDGFSATPSR